MLAIIRFYSHGKSIQDNLGSIRINFIGKLFTGCFVILLIFVNLRFLFAISVSFCGLFRISYEIHLLENWSLLSTYIYRKQSFKYLYILYKLQETGK